MGRIKSTIKMLQRVRELEATLGDRRELRGVDNFFEMVGGVDAHINLWTIPTFWAHPQLSKHTIDIKNNLMHSLVQR